MLDSSDQKAIEDFNEISKPYSLRIEHESIEHPTVIGYYIDVYHLIYISTESKVYTSRRYSNILEIAKGWVYCCQHLLNSIDKGE